MIYCFDLDGTLCTDENGEYGKCRPSVDRIRHLKSLKEQRGHKIIIFTARSEGRRLITEEQLHKWGVPYDELIMGKPKADYYIDDRGWHAEEYYGE